MAKIILTLPSGGTSSKHNTLQGLNEDNYIHLTQLEKANLDNQSGINTGDETTSSIQTKRSLKTVDNKSLEGTGNIEIDYNTVINKPTSFPPSTHTHTVSQITDFPTFKTIENQSIVGAGNIDLNKSDVGLSNVDNTSDLNKIISTATQTALNGKEPIIPTGTALQYIKGDKTLGTFPTIPTVDQSIIDGSTSAVSGNAVFDGLATKFPTPTGLTTNYLPKWNGSGFGNSAIVDTNNEYYFDNTNGRLTFGTSLSENYIFSTTTSFGVFKKLKITSNNLVFNNGTTDLFSFLSNGRILINKTDDDLTNQLQVNGTISASPAVTANQVPTWGQVQAVAKPYKVYTALLTQTGTNAPVATVLENTLGGTVVWSYRGIGFYTATLTGAFTIDKTWVVIGASGNGYATANRADTNTINVGSYLNNSLSQSDSNLTPGKIEIRVYN